MPRKPGPGQVRIIAGIWRSRRLPVAEAPGLRPSGDRVRETLFNWLQPHIAGAVCADLYAGSGALGLEAASRGAASVVLIERHPLAAAQLEENIRALGATQVTLHKGDIMDWLPRQAPATFDLLFADPPFEAGVHGELLRAIAGSGCLKPGGLLYLESAADAELLPPPPGWACWREQRIGEVRLQVFCRSNLRP
jgi:16S rRNA (guanine966-N2)-methyltransferase